MLYNSLQKTLNFFKLPIFRNFKFIFAIWMIMAMSAAFSKYMRGERAYGNYINYKTCYTRVAAQDTIYKPILFADGNYDYIHYGPTFSMVIAPFAMLPNALGLILWVTAMAAVLFWAVYKLPLSQGQRAAVCWISVHEMMTAAFNMQFNIGIAAIIVLAFVFIEEEKDIWAAFVIMLGTFIKLYGIVGLAFFFFSKHKTKFTLSCIGWAIIFFILPMLISSPEYIIDQYMGWYERLLDKNNSNMTVALMQNISFIGMVQRILGNHNLPLLPFLAGGVLLFGLPYLRIKQYKHLGFRLLILASTLIFPVLFSTGSESCTYIVAFIGVGVWYVAQPRPYKVWHIALLIFAMVLSSFSPSDLFPRYIRATYVIPYALKALPITLIWLTICYELCFKNFALYKTGKE